MAKMKKKVVWLPYDFDTAIGINNEGSLVFDYSLEDIDHLEGGADIFNGQESVIWKNIRAAFGEELAAMYRELRSTGALSYAKVEQMFEEHQAKWPEAIFNEDSWFKYILPLTEGTVNSEGKIVKTGSYLPMMQGPKTEQRKWWLYNRFRYIDSKYNAGDALSDLIQLRGYAKADITVKPYADIYPSVKYGSYLVRKRGARGRETVLECPLDNVNDTEIYIYSSSQLASVGDLSGLKVGFADFSIATKLQDLKIGDASETYENPNLNNLTLGSNVLLKTIDVRNCTALGTGDQKSVDISGCSNIEEVYFDNTKVTAVTLPNGGILKKLHLPETITNLTILNQKTITELVAPVTGLSTLRLENVSDAVDIKSIVKNIPASCRVRLIGFYLEFEDADEISAWLDVLDTMRGLDENGNNMDTAQVSGTIHTNALTGAQIAEFNSRYPYLTVTADHTSAQLTYKTHDGSSVIATETVLDGGNGTRTNTTARTADAQYTYSPDGWSTTPNGNKNANALVGVSADRTVYAAYSKTVRTYNVTFVRSSTDGGGTLQTLTGIAYGTAITAASRYTGSTPTTTQGNATDYPFEGWTPASATVTGNTTFTAKFGSPVEVKEITDSWDTIIANIDNGTYASKYKVGNYKPLALGAGGTINMQIVCMDADVDASDNAVPLTFIGIELIDSSGIKMASNRTNAGNWTSSLVRQYLQNVILPSVPSNVKSRIISVKKYSSGSNAVKNAVITYDKLWIPGTREIGAGSGYQNVYETIGGYYDKVYNSDDKRKKTRYNSTTYGRYWLRSASDGPQNFTVVYDTGSVGSNSADSAAYVALGFCLGLEPESITDSWEEIHNAVADGTYKTKYSIGDTKYIDLGTEGKHLMEIVAFDTDDKADGSGKAPISWVSKTLLKTAHRMNPARTANTEGTGTLGGWEKSEMRAYLKDTIKPLIPDDVAKYIVSVTKVQNAYQASDETAYQQTTVDDIWIPGHREIFNSTSCDKSGAVYSEKFKDSASRIKKDLSGSARFWWLRSACNADGFRCVNNNGNDDYVNAYYSDRLPLGFCTE